MPKNETSRPEGEMPFEVLHDCESVQIADSTLDWAIYQTSNAKEDMGPIVFRGYDRCGVLTIQMRDGELVISPSSNVLRDRLEDASLDHRFDPLMLAPPSVDDEDMIEAVEDPTSGPFFMLDNIEEFDQPTPFHIVQEYYDYVDRNEPDPIICPEVEDLEIREVAIHGMPACMPKTSLNMFDDFDREAWEAELTDEDGWDPQDAYIEGQIRQRVAAAIVEVEKDHTFHLNVIASRMNDEMEEVRRQRVTDWISIGGAAWAGIFIGAFFATIITLFLFA